jgi:hypothetical protein
MPSIALSTEIAGVIMPSPWRRAAPNSPSSRSAWGALPSTRVASAIKGQDAALAIIVGAEDEDEVLDGDDEDQRPGDEREDVPRTLPAVDGTACGPLKQSRSA